MGVRGVDISAYQGDFDFAEARRQGVKFVIIRATMGHNEVDAKLDANIKGARGAGMQVAFYHFAYPNLNSADAEAGHLIETLDKRLAEGDVIALDFETAPASAPWALRFLQHVEHALPDHNRIFYSYLSFIEGMPDSQSKKELAKYALWLADYTAVLPAPPAPWKRVAIWQKADSGGLNGRSVDLDIALVDLASVFTVPKPKRKRRVLVVEQGGKQVHVVKYGFGRWRRFFIKHNRELCRLAQEGKVTLHTEKR